MFGSAPAILAAVTLALPASGLQGKRTKAGPPPPLVPYPGRLDAARVAAKERNVPILVHVILEGEEANDNYRRTILPDPDLLRASAGMIVLVANNGTHERKRIEVVVDGETVSKEVCSAYEFDSCAVHQLAWDDCYREFKRDDGVLYCPQTVALLPDGTLFERIDTSNTPSVDEVHSLVQGLLKKAGPGLSEAQLAELKRLLVEGRHLDGEQDWPGAWRAWSRLLEISARDPWGAEARRSLAAAEAGLKAELERLAALLVPGRAAEGWRQLGEYQRRCAGTPFEKAIAQRLKKAETDKSIREEIAAYRTSLEADGLLREAQALHESGDLKKAERAVRKLLGKRYEGTPAQKAARELWPEWID